MLATRILLDPGEPGWEMEAEEDRLILADDSRPETTRGGDALVIYIWKRKGWRKYRVRES